MYCQHNCRVTFIYRVFAGPAEKTIHLFGLMGNSMGIEAYSSGDVTKRRGCPGDTTKRIYCFVDTTKRRGRPGDTTKRIYYFVDTTKRRGRPGDTANLIHHFGDTM